MRCSEVQSTDFGLCRPVVWAITRGKPRLDSKGGGLLHSLLKSSQKSNSGEKRGEVNTFDFPSED